MSDYGLPFTETVTRHRYDSTTRDSTGTEIPVYVDQAVEDTIIYDNVSAETEVATQPLIITKGMSLLWLRQQAVSGLDEFTVRGLRYRVDGDPTLLHHPGTGEYVTQIQLLRRT